MIQVVGYLASIGAGLMWLPQAWRAVRLRHDAHALAGISAVAYLTAVAFNALLLTYGVLNGAPPVVVAGCVNVVCAGVIVAIVLPRRRSAP
jgi:uncharacterized protein with PQ loop repeat